MDVPEVSDLDLAFSTTKYLPPMDEIPEEFKTWNGTKWNRAFSQWFYSGLDPAKLIPKEGIDKGKALRVIKAHIGSFKPKHEHKEAGVAFMMSQWFEDYKE